MNKKDENKNKNKNKDKNKNNEENKEQLMINMLNTVQEIENNEQKIEQNLDLPLKLRVLLKIRSYKNKIMSYIPYKGNKPLFIAYLINNSVVERVKVFKSVNNQFFEYDGTEYYLNRNRVINLPYEKHPALIFKKGVSEPINPTAKNKEITFSNDLSTAVEGTVIDQFNSADINIEYLEKILKMTVGLSFIAIILTAIILFGLIQNGIILGG